VGWETGPNRGIPRPLDGRTSAWCRSIRTRSSGNRRGDTPLHQRRSASRGVRLFGQAKWFTQEAQETRATALGLLRLTISVSWQFLLGRSTISTSSKPRPFSKELDYEFVQVSISLPRRGRALIPHGATVAFSGFTPSGAAKVVPYALAQRARGLHQSNQPFSIRVLTGASTGEKLDEALAQASAISWRAPYQSSKKLRSQINSGEAQFVDMHLSHVPQAVLFGFFGRIDYAVVEAVDVTNDGRIYLSTSIGASPSYLHYADKIIIELNSFHSKRLSEMADIAILPPPPHRSPIPIHDTLSKMGWPYMA